MNISAEELQKEKEYLSQTLEIIQNQIAKDTEGIQINMSDITEMKRYIWENNAELDDVEISSSMYNVNNQVSQANERLKQLLKLKKSLINPYFGRVDFECDYDIDKIYIGINGIRDKHNYYVFDWRTPIASLFYNFGKGSAYYEAPAGKIEGIITKKRQYKINNGKIERCFDNDLNIDDDYLQEILATSSSDKMTNIVNTIQKEQNDVIRNMKDRYLIVQGIAGSGKTSVAMHRIAYLLYSEKDLNSNNVLIFSPNDIFSEYISNVLPELGEENVLQTTFSEFARSYIKEVKKVESFTDYIERYYQYASTEIQKKECSFKMSNEFKTVLDSALHDLQYSFKFKSGIVINDKKIDVNLLNDLLHRRFSSIPLFSRLHYLSEYLCESNLISVSKNRNVIYEKLLSLISLSTNAFELYSRILESNGMIFNSKSLLQFEDLVPIMYLYFELWGYPKDTSIKHVVIDEAQDYTLMQMEMLKKIFYKASFTILGDVHQTINPFYRYSSLNEMNKVFENKGRYLELTKTYRSSAEIIDYTNHILGIENGCAVRRNNSIPVLLRNVEKEKIITQLIQDITIMKDNGMKRIAIIVKNHSEMLEFYNKLKPILSDVCLVSEPNFGKEESVVVLPAYISKGLEFDGVISCVLKENCYKEQEKYLFYVVCTRAQHALTVYNQPELKLERLKK